MGTAVRKARVGKATPKGRATPRAGSERSAPKQQMPRTCQRADGRLATRKITSSAVKNPTQRNPISLSATPIMVKPPGSQEDAIARRSFITAEKVNWGLSALGIKKCQSQ